MPHQPLLERVGTALKCVISGPFAGLGVGTMAGVNFSPAVYITAPVGAVAGATAGVSDAFQAISTGTTSCWWQNSSSRASEAA